MSASFRPTGGTNLPAANQCTSNADCQVSTGQTCVITNGVGTCTCTAGDKTDCPSPYLCDAKPGKSGMCSIDPYSCGMPGRYGARTTARATPSWPAVAIDGCLWNLTQETTPATVPCPAELQQWVPVLNSSGNEVTCSQQSDCSAYSGSSCQYAEDRLAGAPGVQLFCSTYVGCMNPNNVCSNANVYGNTGPYANLACTANQIAIHNKMCSSNADCPVMQGGGNMTCSNSFCVPTCSQTSQCPVGMNCTGGRCEDPVTMTDAAPYSDLYGTTGYSPYTCYSGSPTAYPQQCQGCTLWSVFGTSGRQFFRETRLAFSQRRSDLLQFLMSLIFGGCGFPHRLFVSPLRKRGWRSFGIFRLCIAASASIPGTAWALSSKGASGLAD